MALFNGQHDDLTIKYMIDQSVKDAEGGSVEPATDEPLMDGVADAGTSDRLSRGDHVHPTDTSRASATAVTELQGDVSDLETAVSKITVSKITVTLNSANWSLHQTDVYSQTVSSLPNVTSKTKVDLTPSYSVILSMVDSETLAIYIGNSGGTLTAYAVGKAPTSNLTINGLRYETA